MGGPSKELIYGVLLVGIVASSVVVAHMLKNPTPYNTMILGMSDINTQGGKLEVMKILGLFLGLFLFGLAVAIMSFRVLAGAPNPASGTDPVMIVTLNRVITNTIEQSFIFVCLYINILWGDQANISADHIMLLPVFFILGRIIYAVGYVLAAGTNIFSLRSPGFAINLTINILMIGQLFGWNLLDWFASLFPFL